MVETSGIVGIKFLCKNLEHFKFNCTVLKFLTAFILEKIIIDTYNIIRLTCAKLMKVFCEKSIQGAEPII